jgi:hypothetical protein
MAIIHTKESKQKEKDNIFSRRHSEEALCQVQPKLDEIFREGNS